MSTTLSTLGTHLEERDLLVDGLAVPVESTSEQIHVGALSVLRQCGKEVDYTADEYCDAVTIARRRLNLPFVHVAMAGPSAMAHVAV